MTTLYSEFRKDIISGDWILVVPGRAKKPRDLKKKIVSRTVAPIRSCRFERPFENVDETIIIGYPRTKGGDIRTDWDLLVLKNRYPAVIHFEHKVSLRSSKFFEVIEGAGHHDLIITRDHKKDFPDLSRTQALHVLSAFRDRYCMLSEDANVRYVSMFHNWGQMAGASIFHPHYQMMAIPVIPPKVSHILRGARAYSEKHKKCAFCAMMSEERKKGKRIIAENKDAVAFCPYASRKEFEVRIFPKKHSALFERTPDAELGSVAELLRYVLRKIKKNLNDPDYNFFIHTAPMGSADVHADSFHWYVEICPVYNVSAGFEFDTGMEINVVNPDFAAQILRK